MLHFLRDNLSLGAINVTHRNALLFCPLVVLLACQSDDRLSDKVLDHIESHDLASRDLPSGNWVDKNGSRICDGFLTRRADHDFCAAEIPSDWLPFEFDGKTYYMQPLSGQDR